MSKYLLLMLSLVVVFIAGCTSNVEVTNFEECVEAGNPVMESYPEQCRHGDKTFTREINVEEELNPNTCSQEDKENQVCTREYNPVCGDDGNTYPTACTGCSTGNIDSWEEGECGAGSTTEVIDLVPECEKLNGTWVEGFNECEYISQESCESLNGTFNECASACRNNPEAEMCTMQCVLVCDFK